MNLDSIRGEIRRCKTNLRHKERKFPTDDKIKNMSQEELVSLCISIKSSCHLLQKSNYDLRVKIWQVGRRCIQLTKTLEYALKHKWSKARVKNDEGRTK